MASNRPTTRSLAPSSAKISTKSPKGSPERSPSPVGKKKKPPSNQQSVVGNQNQQQDQRKNVGSSKLPPGNEKKVGFDENPSAYSGRNASVYNQNQSSPSKVMSKIPQQDRNQSLVADVSQANYNKHKKKEKKGSRVKSEPLATTFSRIVSKKSREASKGRGSASKSKPKKGSKSPKGSEAELNIDENPTTIECPHCHTVVKTEIEKVPKTIAFIVCCLSIGLCCFCGCCLIPFCLASMNDIRHICPECGFVIGIYYT